MLVSCFLNRLQNALENGDLYGMNVMMRWMVMMRWCGCGLIALVLHEGRRKASGRSDRHEQHQNDT